MQVNRKNKLLVWVAKMYIANIDTKPNLQSLLTITRAYHKIWDFIYSKIITSGITITRASVLYDKANPLFKPLNITDGHQLFTKLLNNANPFTQMKNDITEKIDRPYLLVSSTSFTPDEDFDVILKAFDAIDGTLNRSIYIFITGKGPLKQKYEADFRNRKYKQISVFFVWLSYEEYAQLLGCADMGISVHYSSSGLDLPMKVVDMFGSGLPVFAYYFET